MTQVQATGFDGTSVKHSYTYDALGRKLSDTLYRRTSPANSAQTALTTTTTYDAADRAVQVTDALGDQINTTYDANGQLYQIIGHYIGAAAPRIISTRAYDAADRLSTHTDALGHVTAYAHDAAGNVTGVTDPNGHTTQYQYDAIGRRTSSTDALGYITQYQYDANNNITCVIDANATASMQPKNSLGCTVSTVYDELNRPIRITDALNNVTHTTHDLPGNPIAITDAAGHITAMAYDGLGRQTSQTDSLGKTTSMAYDEAGNVWQTTNRLNQISLTTYDNLNRPISDIRQADNNGDNIGYDSYGNRQSINNAQVSYTYTYDALNHLLSKIDSRAGRSMQFTYDPAGNIHSKTDYQGDITTYEYDSANNLVGMANPAYLQAAYQHDGAGNTLTRMLSNGAKTIYTYDADGRTATLAGSTANGTVTDTVTYTRDRVGNIVSQIDNGATTYTYDALYRLQSASYADGSSESYTYDAVGNRLTQVLNGAAHAYEYYANSNRLKAIHTGSLSGAIEKSFTYDNEGRLVNQSGVNAKTLQWDQNNHATNISGTTYQYDPLGYRIGVNALDYYLDGEYIESTYAASQQVQTEYFRCIGADELLVGFSYTSGIPIPAIYQQDGLMNITGISAHDGPPIWSTDYSAFGDRLIGATGVNNGNIGYTGRELDSSGLYYYRARYYDPSTGRFDSEDPLGFQGSGVNWYVYVGNNPVNGNDPSGMDAVVDPWLWTNIGLGAASFAHNVYSGHWGWAAVDAAGLAYDAASGIVPFFPAGASAGLQALQAGNTIINSAQVGMDVARAAEVSNNVARAASTTGSAMQTGQAIHREVGAILDEGNMLSGSANNFFRGANGATGKQADLSWSNAPSVWVDLTTPGQWGAHVDTYSSLFGDGIPLLYKAGQGLTNTTGLLPFMGTATTASQALFGSGDSAAAGGFLLYPNKPNNNQMQSVYQK